MCGTSPVSGTAVITVSKLLATEPTLPLEVRTWPNPTTGLLQLEGNLPTAEAVQIQVTTVSGTLVQSQTVCQVVVRYVARLM